MNKFIVIVLVSFSSLFSLSLKDLAPTFMLNDTTKLMIAAMPYGGYSTDTDLFFGLASSVNIRKYNSEEMTYDNMLEQFSFSPVFSYTLKDQYNIYLTTNYLVVDDYQLYNRIKVSYFPDKFYGIGNNTNKDDEEEFTEEYIRAETYGIFRTFKNLWIGGYLYFRQSEVSEFVEGGLFDLYRYRGLEECYITGVGPYIVYNTKDHINFPTKGFQIKTKYLYFPDLISEYEFSKYSFEFSAYKDFFDDGGIFACRVVGDLTFSDDVPYFELYSLGGDEALMGIKDSRYRDLNRLFATVEYRKELFMKAGITLFASVGTISDSQDKFSSRDIKTSFGGGFRYNLVPDEKLYLRADIGIGSNGDRGFYFMVGETF